MSQEKQYRIFFICLLFLFVTISLSAFEGFKPGDRCFLIDQKTVILFSKDNSTISCLKWGDEFSSTVIHKYVGDVPWYWGEFEVIKLPNEDTFVTWIELIKGKKEIRRISSITLDKAYNPRFSVIKEDQDMSHLPLHVVYLGGNKFRFFNGDAGELHLVAYEAMEYDKIKTFIYSDGKISDERILNRRGRFSIEDYDVRLAGDNSFQVVWCQGYMISSKQDIYLASYSADGSEIKKPKKIYSFSNTHGAVKGYDSYYSYIHVALLRDGFFLGRQVRSSPNEIYVFDNEGKIKQNYQTVCGGWFSGYWEQGGMCCFVGEIKTPGKKQYLLQFDAVSDNRNFSKGICVSESKNQMFNYIHVKAAPDGLFYWLEVYDDGNVQLRSIPIEN